MAYTEVSQTNQAIDGSFDGTGQNTSALVVKKGETATITIGTGYTGNFQIQVSPVGVNNFQPTPFNGSLNIANGGVTAMVWGASDCLVRVATVSGTGTATVNIRK